MKNHLALSAIILAFGALPAFAQSTGNTVPQNTYNNQPQLPPARAEDPAYLENSRARDQYTVDQPQTAPVQPAPIERNPASAPQPPQAMAPAPSAPAPAPIQPAPVQPSATEPSYRNPSSSNQQYDQNQNINQPQKKPMYLEQIQKDQQNQNQPQTNQPATNLRNPASAQPQPAAAAPAENRSQSASEAPAAGTQSSFFEISPSLGSIAVAGKATFSLGTFLSFNVWREHPLFFEPGLFVSFLSGDNNQNTTLFHVNAGLRYDFVINESPIVPFVRAGIGPTFASNSNVTSNGNKVSSSYINQLYGGGLRILINPHISARADAGLTFQGTDTGLYAMGAVALPL
jgi:hypothetical protein